MRFRRALIAVVVLALPLTSGTAQAAARVGCNPLAVLVDGIDGLMIVDGADLGLPAPSASDPVATRAFEDDGLETLLVVSVSEYDTAIEASEKLGDFSEGFLNGATSSVGPVALEPGSVAYTGTSPGANVEARESTAARYVVAAIVLLRGGSTAESDGGSILDDALAAQLRRIPDYCLSDVVDEGSDLSPSRASKLGEIGGLILLGGGSIWAAWTLARRARRSDPTEIWAP